MLKSVNPFSQEIVGEYDYFSGGQLEQALVDARSTYATWRKTPLSDRCQTILSLAEKLSSHREEYAQLISQEMGKPIRQALAEIDKCVLLCQYYSEQAPHFLADKVIQSHAKKSWVSYQPLGAILGIMPWNFPFWQVLRFAIPALLAGNVILLKHADNVTGCALIIEELFQKSAGGQKILQSLRIKEARVAEVIASDIVHGVALTGSDRAGRAVAALAGQQIKRCVMELGGSDAFIVLADAQLEKAAKKAVASRMNNNGQTCISAKRVIVEQSVAKEFSELLQKEMKALQHGTPEEEKSQLTCLARPDLVDNLHRQVEESLAQGAKLIYRGKEEKVPNYFPPMLLGEVKKGMPAYHEELFGPVMTLFEVDNVAEAIQLTNDSAYGLGAAIWTENKSLAEQIAMDLEVGAVAINNLVRSDPRLPFGGVKRSGYGRELAEEGIREFLNIKSISLF